MCQGHNPHLDPKDNTDSRQLLYSCCVPKGFNLVHVSWFIRGIAIFTGLTGLYIDCTERFRDECYGYTCNCTCNAISICFLLNNRKCKG